MLKTKRDRVKPTAKRCRVCDRQFVPNTVTATLQRYCSKRCQEKNHRLKRTLYLNNWGRNREQQERAATVGKFGPIDVFERDGWNCWLCGHPTDRTQVHPQPMAPTVDHVIPISKGGEHSMANCRCAHSTCNVKKNNKLMNDTMMG
jgi:5-methylcytosine-specific restriction endonuclease McrA